MVEESFNWLCFLRPLFIFPWFYDGVFCLQLGLCFGLFPVCVVVVGFFFFFPQMMGCDVLEAFTQILAIRIFGNL